MDTIQLQKAFQKLRAWKDEYASIFSESVDAASENHAVATELFSRMEEYFIGAEVDFSQFEILLRKDDALGHFQLHDASQPNAYYCFNEGEIDLLVEKDEARGIAHDSFHFPVLLDYVVDGLRCLKQYKDLPQNARTFLATAVASLIRDQIKYWNQDIERCYCDACEKDYQVSKEILAKADDEKRPDQELSEIVAESAHQLVQEISSMDEEDKEMSNTRDILLSHALHVRDTARKLQTTIKDK